MIQQVASLIVEQPVRPLPHRPAEDSDHALVQALLAEKVLTPQAAAPLLSRRNSGEARSLIELLVAGQIAKLEDIMVGVVQRSGLPYLPLAQYNAPESTAWLLPADFCARHSLVPFDRMSRAVLVATANPFDQAARDEVARRLGCRVFWFVSAPAEIAALLERAHQGKTQRNS